MIKNHGVSPGNENTWVFTMDRDVAPNNNGEFNKKNIAQAQLISPLATLLLQIKDVEQVFFGDDFISFTKANGVKWGFVGTAVKKQITEYDQSGVPFLFGIMPKSEATEKFSIADKAIVAEIKELLETRVKPAVAKDGGRIVFKEFNRGVLTLDMQGACSTCKTSAATLQQNIFQLMQHYVPEVVEVKPYAGPRP